MSKHFTSKAAIAAVMAGIVSLSPALPAVLPATTALADTVDLEATTIDVSSLSEGKYEGYKVEAAEILDEDGNAVDGYSGTTVTIQEAGAYVLTGSAENVNVVVKKGLTGVSITLDNLTLSCDYTAPIVIKKGSEVSFNVIGTNTITDNENIENDGKLADFEGACIKSKDGSTVDFSGSGTLNIVGNCKHGVRATCNPGEEGETGAVTLTLFSGTYNISVQDETGDNATQDGDGIHSDDMLNIGTVGTTDSDLTINITKANEGLEGGKVNIFGGTVNVITTDDGINAANKDYAAANISYDFEINISGGKVNVVAAGDGIDSNGNVVTSGGTIVASSTSGGNAAMDVGDGGSYGWTNSGATVVLFGQGSMEVVPTSGLYVAWGANGMGGGFGGDMGGRGNWGGDGTGDGSSANGSRGNRPEMPSNGQTPPDMPADGGMGGGQAASSVSYTSGQEITLTDASGNTVWSGTAPISGGSFIYSAADLTEGETYTLKVAGSEAGTATAAVGSTSSGGFQPGGPDQPGTGEQPTDPGQPATGEQPTTPDSPTTPEDPKSETWVYEDGAWYVKYADGSTKTGWTWLNGDWYYLDAANGGAMKTGWTYDGGQWYYLNESHDGTYGKMMVGWIFDGGKWYYLNENSDGTQGAMLRNTTVDGYVLGADGAWIG